MAKIVIEVPDGNHCNDCEYIMNLEVQRTDITTFSDARSRYLTIIAGQCRLFPNERIMGKALDALTKCPSCIENSIRRQG